MVAPEPIAKERTRDGDAFGALTGPYVRELRVHCYRMLGSFQDAEDALQNTLLTARQAWAGSRDAPRCAPGCTGLPPTGAWTRAGRPAGARPRSGMCLALSGPS